MGPIVKAYAQRYPNEKRVYLSEASAAMLWKHPLFSGTENEWTVQPTLEFDDFEVVHDEESERLVITGRIRSDYQAHSVVVGEHSGPRGGYWNKCFVGRVKEDGRFEVIVDELSAKSGAFRIVSCFHNGAVVGQERDRQGLSTGFIKKFSYRNGTYTFDTGWAARDQRPRRRPASRRKLPTADQND